MEFREIYCSNCKKVLGNYNIKFYSDEKIGEIVNMYHTSHIRSGHQVTIRKLVKKAKS